jgi:hypothetical protein
MNDLCKVVTIVSGIIVTGIFFPFIDFAYGESDFTLEAKVNPLHLDVTRFEISGESDKQICPSGQCNIELDSGLSSSFDAPSINTPRILYNFDFKVHDNDNQTNIGAIKKRFMEPFNIGTSISGCKIDDIIEDNGQEIYYCHGISIMDRNFDSAYWYYDTNGIYDAKKNTLKVYGNYTMQRCIVTNQTWNGLTCN